MMDDRPAAADGRSMHSSARVRALAQHHLPQGRTLPEAEWRRRHRGLLLMLWFLGVTLPLYGAARGHALGHDLASGAMLLAVAATASGQAHRRARSSALVSYGLCLASAIAVHLADGATEAHFMFFVVIIVISLYEDWRSFLIAFGFVVLHHGVMGFLDHGGVYDHAGNPWMLAFIHGAFVAAAGIACVVSWRLNEDVRAESRVASERASASDARFRSAFQDGPVGMALVNVGGDELGTMTQVNRTLCAQFGQSAEALRGSDIGALMEAGSLERFACHIDGLLAGRIAVAHDELGLRLRAGRSFEARVSMSLVAAATPGAGRDLILQIEDVTERNRLKNELQDLADHDSLTGLLNRRRFGAELARRASPDRRDRGRGAVILIDLDGFKEINDTLGHEAGDRLLVSVAAALRSASRQGDVVARLGGDEFALLVAEASVRDAERIGRRILERLHERAVIGEGRDVRHVSASVGILVYSRQTELSGDQLLNDADLAMYEAKAAGGGHCVVYCADPVGPAEAVAARSWPDRIRRALDDQRFELYAQPIVDLASDRITNFELLLRMIGSDGEVILPGAFLPVAERRGMIRAIDRWVISHAIDLLAELPADADADADDREGPLLRVHVNISGRSLSDGDFLACIRSELARTGVDPHQLVFEVTETAAIANLDDARHFLASLSELGCGIALDDFGAGFGSLHYLKNLPVDVLKIDGQFIRNLKNNPDDLVVVESLVRMSRGLRMRTAAEYVEDGATLSLLTQLGVDLAQGYHIGRPEPARTMIRSRRARRSAA
jgi:diguanylate cyclase (GGDEF)-like protein/PAS domain S-box-containing protein